MDVKVSLNFSYFINEYRNTIGSEVRSKRRTKNVRRNVWRSACLFIRVKYIGYIAGVSKDERTESGFTRRSSEQTRKKNWKRLKVPSSFISIATRRGNFG